MHSVCAIDILISLLGASPRDDRKHLDFIPQRTLHSLDESMSLTSLY
jgi:hypothetical protein